MRFEKVIFSLAVSFASAAHSQEPAKASSAPLPTPTPAVSPAVVPIAFQTADETLWKTEFLDTVIAMRKCPESGMCGYLYWMNPKDEKIIEYMGERKSTSDGEISDSADDVEKSIKALCGYSPKLQFKQVADGQWKGTMQMRGYGMNVNVDVKILSETELSVVSSKAFVTKKETWRKIAPNDARYPKCTLPKK